MPYFVLVIGILFGLFALYRFFLRANVAQIRALIYAISTGIIAIALLYLSVTGRLPAALGLLAAVTPIFAGYFVDKRKGKNPSPSAPENMTRKEALEILGLEDGANKDDIMDAYKSLMKKVHPDQDGSEWMAQKLNAAKDFLLQD